MTDQGQGDLGAHRLGQWLRGKYRLDSVIGVGGMAAVYAATHRNSKRFAIKMLHPELSVSADICRRFLREGYAANTVDHPGAVAVLDDDVAEDGAAFLVMELLEGMTLDAIAEPMSPKELLPIIDQLLDVLVAAHAKEILHRDIKPANVFVTKQGEVKVLDFGIARLRDARTGVGTQTGAYVGTPAFMAPEQAAGRSSLMDGRSDVWAVGATMFRKLTGRDVHLGETAQHVMMLSATSQPVSLAAALPGAAPPLVLVVDRALAFDRGARWPTAGAMQTAVRSAERALFGGLLAPTPSHAMRPVSMANPSSHDPSQPSVLSPHSAHGVAATVAATPVVTGAPSRGEASLLGGPVSVQSTAAPVSSSLGAHTGGRRGLVAVAAFALAIVGLAAGVAITRLRAGHDRLEDSPSSAHGSASAAGSGHEVASAPPDGLPRESIAVPPSTGLPPELLPEPVASTPTAALPAPPSPRHPPSVAKPHPAASSADSPNNSNDFDRQ